MKFIIGLVFICSFFCSCSENKQKGGERTLKNISSSDTLFNDYAECFRIIEHSASIEIQIFSSDKKSVEFNYVFSDSEASNTLKFNPNRVVALSSTHIGMMEELQLLDKIVGISDAQYLCSPELKKRIDSELTRSIGDIGMADIEGYIDVKPDLVIYSGFDTKAPILKKLESAGIKTFTNYDWKETHPLGRAEWLKVFGVIFNKRKEAEELFRSIESEYLDLVEEVKNYASNESVLVGTLYGDVFNAPAGESYMAKILKDANLNYKYKDTKGVGSISLTLEEVISENRKTSIWLNVAAQDMDKVLEMNDRFRLMESVQKEHVFSYYQEVNCFWEQSAIRPHLLLQDICKIAYPEQFSGKTFTFYNKLD